MLMNLFRPLLSRKEGQALPPGSVLGFRWGALSRQRRTAIGIDFGSGCLKLAQVRWMRQGPRLENYAIVPMAPGMVDEGAITRPAEMAELLAAVFAELGISQNLVGTAIGGPAILMRHINLPRVSEEEMKEAMRFEAPQHLPIPEESLIYDFTPVPQATGVPEHQTAVFLAGTNRRLIDTYLAVFHQCGLRPQAIELDAFAEQRTLQFGGMLPELNPPPYVLLDLGESGTRVSVFQYGVPVLTRTIPTGLGTLRTAIADATGAHPHDAELMLRKNGLKANEQVASAVEPWLKAMLDAVGRSIEFFLIQNRGVMIERVLLTGGGAMLPGIGEALAAHLDEAVTNRPEAGFRIQPVGLAGIDINPELLPQVTAFGPVLTVALGSALREETVG
jgi:type IV pilus assembly protein PilM